MIGGPLSIATMLGAAILEDGQIAEQWGAIAFFMASGTLVFAVCLVLLATPLWLLLHGLGYRSWLTAASLGTSLGFFTSMFLYVAPHLFRAAGSSYSYGGSEGLIVDGNRITDLGWRLYLSCSFGIALVCLVVGLVIWRIAYRRASTQASLD